MRIHKSHSVICKRSTKNGGWLVSEETYSQHLRQNNKIRKSIKPITKPDLDNPEELKKWLDKKRK